MSSSSCRSYNVAIISDFNVPRLGGVETHQYSLAQALIQRGHKVILVSGTYSDRTGRCARQGVRYVTGGLKIFYLPLFAFVQQASPPSLFTCWPWFRSLVLRERIDIVHAHSATSFLAHEAVLHASSMGLSVLYTDHSLFSLHSLQSLHLNKMTQFTLSLAQRAIAVSHCDKINLALRAQMDLRLIHVIPNAVDCTDWMPNVKQPELLPFQHESYRIELNRVVVVVISRLVYRKGLDLIVPVIPLVCQMFQHVDFIIGGDGPKRSNLENMIEEHSLQSRVTLLGFVKHEQVKSVLERGHIFLNCSLTESFCIAILEAVSAGLDVVATRVGGVPEILPHHMIHFAEPNSQSILEALSTCIERLTYEGQSHALRMQRHEMIRTMYNWHDIAQRTVCVYNEVVGEKKRDLRARVDRVMQCGVWAGPLFALIVIVDAILLKLLDWWMPEQDIEEAISWPKPVITSKSTDAYVKQSMERSHDVKVST